MRLDLLGLVAMDLDGTLLTDAGFPPDPATNGAGRYGRDRCVRPLGRSGRAWWCGAQDDLPMLAFARIAVAVRDAHPSVPAAADLVMSGDDAEGVAEFLEAVVAAGAGADG